MRRTASHIRDGFVQLAQQRRNALKELPPFARETQLARGPIEETHAEFALQSGNALAYGGWCELEPVCRRDEEDSLNPECSSPRARFALCV